MIDFQTIMQFYKLTYSRIWKIFFKSNFKSFGKSSNIILPLKVQNAKYIEIGDNVYIRDKAWLSALTINGSVPRLLIDDGTVIGHFSTISSIKDVYIGKNVLISDNVYISDNVHRYEDITCPINTQPTIFKGSVNIGDDSWIGKNVSIIGAKVGKHCVIGANAVITRDIPDYSVAVGSPASPIKRYNFKIKKWQSVSEDGLFIDE